MLSPYTHTCFIVLFYLDDNFVLIPMEDTPYNEIEFSSFNAMFVYNLVYAFLKMQKALEQKDQLLPLRLSVRHIHMHH